MLVGNNQELNFYRGFFILNRRVRLFKDALVLLILLVVVSTKSSAANVLYSSVSPEFPNGLHVKYLQYIASKMNMQLDIVPMPFARRMASLQRGQIDLMVSMQKEQKIDQNFIYIYPSYEQLRHTFFVLAGQQTKLTQFEDLLGLNIGVTIDVKYFQNLEQQQGLNLLAVSTLKQKIELLLIGRIDTFIHYQQGTEPVLKLMQLENKVVVAPYQPAELNEYYVVISKKSRLFPYQEKLQHVIKAAVENNDFGKIREQHFQP